LLTFFFGYLAFMAAATAMYLVLPIRFKELGLVLASLVFVLLFIPHALPYLLSLILFNFLFSRALLNENANKNRLLQLGIAVNVGLYICYRLTVVSFRLDISNLFPQKALSDLSHSLLIHLGAVFITLQSISYLIELHRGKISPNTSLLALSNYLLFFPKLIAGPIEKPGDFFIHNNKHHVFNRQRIAEGARLVLWGMFQKMVIADRMAVISSAALSKPADHFGWELVLGAICFMFELYFDLCAYVNISVGFAHMMGFRMSHHFNLPFAADRPIHYWNRVMTSLTAWVKDYLASPIARWTGKSKPRLAAAAIPILCTLILFIGGGAGFLLWGMVWIISAAGSRTIIADKIPALELPFASKWLVWITACLASIFLALSSFKDGTYFFLHVFQRLNHFQGEQFLSNMGITSNDFFIAILALVMASIVGFGRFGMKSRYPQTVFQMYEKKPWKRWVVFYIGVILLLIFSVSEKTVFIFGF
jgi:alginate O-acetyltransferase complex protein AlgI